MKNINPLYAFILWLLIPSIWGQSLESELQSIATNHDMMGMSVVVFCKNGITENIALGTADHTRNIEMTTSSKYRIASVSKTITAIAVMQLVDQNLLNLDEDISNILGFEVKNPHNPDVAITTRMLLSHTSTIIDGSTYSSFLGATVNNNPIPNLSEILAVGGQYYNAGQFNNTLPGSYFNYSNINYVILGTLIEKVSNLRFDVYCRQNIFQVLGIDASFNVNDLDDIDELAVLYRKPGGVWTAQVDNFQGVQPVFTNLDNYTPGTNGGRFGPQGGLRCSAEDVAKIFLCLMNDGTFESTILSPESVSAMLANEWTFSGNNGNNYYGLFRSWGLGIHRTTSTPGNDVVLPGSVQMFGHTGEAYGLVSDAYFDTLRKVGFVFMNNGVGVGYQTNTNSVFYTVEQEVFQAIETYGNLAVCMTATNDQIDIPEITLYPNPVRQMLQLSGLDIPGKQTYSITNTAGQEVLKGTISPESRSIHVDNLTPGVYVFSCNGLRISFVKE